MLLSVTVINAQDVIVKKDSSTIICKVIEIGTSEVKYKKHSNLDGPLYTITIMDIESIEYENGEKEMFDDVSISAESEVTTNNNDVVLYYGAEIPIQIVSPVKARDVKIGQSISFRTISDIVVSGVKVIPSGTPVTGIVYRADRSSWFGTKGKLGINIDHLTLSNGTRIPLKGNIYVTGHNRSALSVLLFLFVTWPACFICGTKAEILPGFEAMASLKATVQFPFNGIPVVTTYQLSHLSLSSIAIPSLPCNATLTDINGDVWKVRIKHINKQKHVVGFKMLDDNGKAGKKIFFYKEKHIHSIEFEK